MKQHIPEVSRSDVERVTARDFPSGQVAQVLKTLSRYGTEPFHQGPDRVHLDILKLAAGDLHLLSQETENACCDYRDTIVAAEYPNYRKKMFRIKTLSREERERLIETDREQYEAWLHQT